MKNRLPSGFGSFLIPLAVMHFAHEISWGGLVGLMPLIRGEFDLSYATAGLLVSAFGMTYGIAQMPLRRLADRVDCRLLIAIGVTCASFSEQ